MSQALQAEIFFKVDQRIPSIDPHGQETAWRASVPLSALPRQRGCTWFLMGLDLVAGQEAALVAGWNQGGSVHSSADIARPVRNQMRLPALHRGNQH